MPSISPVVAAVVLVVPLVSLDIVLPERVIVPVPADFIPNTDCALAVEAELALMLFASVVLPMVLLLMVVVPALEALLIP